jgi:hypothetical protein
MSTSLSAALAPNRLLDLPELNVWFFAFLVNYPWEFLQAPWYQAMPDMRHWEAVKFCSWAAVGDGLLAVLAFWAVALFRSRGWLRRPTPGTTAGFTGIGLALTIAVEWLATDVWARWSYVPEMPTVPLLGTGLAPFLQWLVLPPLVVGIVSRQLGGGGGRHAPSRAAGCAAGAGLAAGRDAAGDPGATRKGADP